MKQALDVGGGAASRYAGDDDRIGRILDQRGEAGDIDLGEGETRRKHERAKPGRDGMP